MAPKVFDAKTIDGDLLFYLASIGYIGVDVIEGFAQTLAGGRKPSTPADDGRGEDFCRDQGLDARSDEANYGFLKLELQTSHKDAIDKLKNETTLSGAFESFMDSYEGPGITTSLPEYDGRSVLLMGFVKIRMSLEFERRSRMEEDAPLKLGRFDAIGQGQVESI